MPQGLTKLFAAYGTRELVDAPTRNEQFLLNLNDAPMQREPLLGLGTGALSGHLGLLDHIAGRP